MSRQSLPIELERKVAARNMARFYVLEIERDLFGAILARRRWGRIGTMGRSLERPFSTVEEAQADLARLERSKRRKGYVDRPERQD
jgi:predicted DNA-binding WGR domain protein